MSLINRLVYFWVFTGLLLFILPAKAVWASNGSLDSKPNVTVPYVTAEAAVLMDPFNSQFMYEHNANRRLPIASVTKILTALVVLENVGLDELVTISENASRVEGSRIYLDRGETQTVRNLLYALLLESANDAAIALAEHVAGSEERFAQLMNTKAAELGARNSKFVNPHGLPAEGHYSTARDVAIITAKALNNPVFAGMVATKEYKIPWPAKDSTRTLYNHNRLLYGDGDITGVKTGYTSEAGSCLVLSAARDGRVLIAVVLNSTSDRVYKDSRALLDYGFEVFEKKRYVSAGDRLGSLPVRDGIPVPVIAKEGFSYSLPRSSKTEIRMHINPLDPLEAPVFAGTRVGEAVFLAGNNLIGKVDLVAAETVIPLVKQGKNLIWLAGAVPVFAGVAISRIQRRRRKRRRLRRYELGYISLNQGHMVDSHQWIDRGNGRG